MCDVYMGVFKWVVTIPWHLFYIFHLLLWACWLAGCFYIRCQKYMRGNYKWEIVDFYVLSSWRA